MTPDRRLASSSTMRIEFPPADTKDHATGTECVSQQSEETDDTIKRARHVSCFQRWFDGKFSRGCESSPRPERFPLYTETGDRATCDQIAASARTGGAALGSTFRAVLARIRRSTR